MVDIIMFHGDQHFHSLISGAQRTLEKVGEHCGSEKLTKAVRRIRSELVCFGQLSNAWMQLVFLGKNMAQKCLRLSRGPRVANDEQAILWAFQSSVWQGGEQHAFWQREQKWAPSRPLLFRHER